MAVRVSLLMALLIGVLISSWSARWRVSASQKMINISVNDKGSNGFSCLNGIGSCKSLQYVLQKLVNVTNLGANISINVSSNQGISGYLPYNFTSSVNITVFGVDRPFIFCENSSSLSITADEHCQVEWAWVGLVFYGCGYLVPSNNLQPNPSAGLYHANLHSVTIHDCSLIMLSQLELISIHQVTISNSQFKQFMPCVCLAIIINLKGDNFLFTNNIITDYTCLLTPNAPHDSLKLIFVDHNNNFTFASNVVSNLFSFDEMINNDVIILRIGSGTAILRNNSFTNIDIRYSTSVVYFDSSGSDGLTTTIIEKNYFSLIVSANILTYNVIGSDSFYMKGNQFTNNRNVGLILPAQMAGNVLINLLPIFFVLDELILINNTFTHNGPIWISSQSISIKHVYAKQNYANNEAHYDQATIFVVGGLGLNFALNGNLTMSNLTFISNTIDPITDSSALVTCTLSGTTSTVISDVTFKNNTGTPININFQHQNQVALTVSGIFLFVKNTGINGGACSFYQVYVQNKGTVNMTFKDNVAVHGGALYLAESNIDFDSSVVLQFQNNKAQTAGDSIYFATTHPSSIDKSRLSNWFKNVSELSSTATGLTFANEENNGYIPFFPGQEIRFNFSITDDFMHSSSCSAVVYLFCNGTISSCYDANIFLEGPATVVISQESDMNMTTVDTNLILSSPETANVEVSLKFECIGNQDTATQVHLNMTTCPLGFAYSSSRSVCECVQVVEKSKFRCSTKYGAACVSHGYWYGQVNYTFTVYTVASCTFPECSYTYTPCPPQLLTTAGSSEEFVLLRHDPDDQCSTGRGGVLCSSCRSGFVFTFTAVNCVEYTECQVWQPYLVVLISLVFQIMFAVVLVLIVRFKISLGSGYLYGPMLFLSVISNLPLTHYPQYSFLNTLVSVLSSIPLLNLEVFGLIPWCFFHPFDKIYNYSLQYFGPLTVLVVILVIAFVARQCPNALRRLQTSPLRAICLLMILSFWSLADTSVNILTPTVITYSQNFSTYVVLLQPDMGYFSLQYLPVAIPALLVIVGLITPLLVLLLFFPLLSKVISLHRIKPLLDDFQACYKDRFRWYAAVYFIVWLINVIMRCFSVPTAIIQTLFTVLLASQVSFQPYADKLMNTANTFLLLVINLLIALVQSNSVTTAPASVVLIHILVIGPVLCITVWFGCVFITKCGVCNYFCTTFIKRRQSITDNDHSIRHVNAPTQQKVYYIEEDGEREPLIKIVNYH